MWADADRQHQAWLDKEDQARYDEHVARHGTPEEQAARWEVSHVKAEQSRALAAPFLAAHDAQMSAWEVLNEACGGTIFSNEHHLRAMRRADIATSTGERSPQEIADHVGSSKLIAAVQEQIALVEAMSPTELDALYATECAAAVEEDRQRFQPRLDAGEMDQAKFERLLDYTREHFYRGLSELAVSGPALEL